MADKRLKSISFPGLPDNYTIPSVDDTLTQQGEAADAKVVSERLFEVSEGLAFEDILYHNWDFIDKTNNGIKYEKEESNYIHVYGITSDSSSWNNLIQSTKSIPDNIIKGEKYICIIESDISASSGIFLQLYKYVNGVPTKAQDYEVTSELVVKEFVFPEDADGIVVRIFVNKNVSVDNHIRVHICRKNEQLKYYLDSLEDKIVFKPISPGEVPNLDFNLIEKSSVLFASSGKGWLNMPPECSSGWLLTHVVNTGIIMQIFYRYVTYTRQVQVFYRLKAITGVWLDWTRTNLLLEERALLASLAKNGKLEVLLASNIVPQDIDIETESGTLIMTWTDINHVHVTANLTNATYVNLYSNANQLPMALKAGKKYIAHVASSIEQKGIHLRVYPYINGVLGSLCCRAYHGKTVFDFPADATGAIIRVDVPAGTFDEDIDLHIFFSGDEGENVDVLADYGVSSKTYESFDDILESGLYTMSSPSNIITNSTLPVKRPGYLFVFSFPNKIGVLQMYFAWKTDQNCNYIRSRTSGVWDDWKAFSSSSDGGGYIDQRTLNYNTYSNVYNITATPTITIDENGWLQPTGDDTDMSGAIMALLQANGYCHLAPGTFYISGNIEMPEFATLEGCGRETWLELLPSVSSGYCVRIHRYNTIRGICFSGQSEALDLSDGGLGEKYGIYCVGNADGEEEPAPQGGSYPSFVSDCYFRNFDNSAIYLHNLGGSVRSYVDVVNCYIMSCAAGINIDYYAEYNKFTNIITNRCYYGCINQGGNNVFTACTFHATIGFLMGDADGVPRNSGHGSAVGCTFNHIDNWNRPETLGGGDALKIINIVNGFIFTGCQFWYGAFNIANSRGIHISDSLIGGGSPEIKTSGAYTIFFDGCVFHQEPNRTADEKSRYFNCFLDATGEEIS